MVLAADPHGGARNLAIGMRLGAPEPVAVGAELELALAVGLAGQGRAVGLARRKDAHLGIGHRLAVAGGELDRDLMAREQVEGQGRPWRDNGKQHRGKSGLAQAKRTDTLHQGTHDTGKPP